jgi:DNA-binding phage protein
MAYEIKVPGFHECYLPLIDDAYQQINNLTRTQVATLVLASFDMGRREYQDQYMLSWMKAALSGGRLSQKRAAAALGIGRTGLNRRLSGDTNTSLKEISHFYITLGERFTSKAPIVLLPRHRLNLGGYIKAVSALRKVINENKPTNRFSPTLTE